MYSPRCAHSLRWRSTPKRPQQRPLTAALFGTTTGALVITATPNLGYIGPATTPIVPQAGAITIVAGNTGGVTTNCAAPQGWGTYTVVAGDTLGTIADSTGTTIDQLVSANCLTVPA